MTLAAKQVAVAAAPAEPTPKVRTIAQDENLVLKNGVIVEHTLVETLFAADGSRTAVVIIDAKAKANGKSKYVTAQMPHSFTPSPSEDLSDLTGFFAHASAAAEAIVPGSPLLAEGENVLVPALSA